MIVFPNGKINLGLSVLKKRDDGYHNIESIVYPVPIFDVLEFYPSKQLTLELYGLEIQDELSDNIVFKAWHLMHQNYNLPPIHIKLLKGIPIGSGLGGGSADAAFLLKSLNSYFLLNLSTSRLKEYAASLGSDCPFFIDNKAAIIKGRGEIVEQVDLNLKAYRCVIVVPDFQVSTKEAYQNFIAVKHNLSLTKVLQKPFRDWQGILINDFENITFEKHPQLKEIKAIMLKEGAIYASLTGSGSAVFGIFDRDIEMNKFFPDYHIRYGLLN